MNVLRGIGTIAEIELRQRVRGVAYYVLLGVVALLLLVVTAGVTFAFNVASMGNDTGSIVYSVVVFFVLLVTSLVTPALGGNAVNGDRDNGTLATTQVTQITTTQLVLGKFLATWVSSFGFLVIAIPFLLWSFALGGTQPATIVVSILVLAVELGVVSAVAVGLSGVIGRPLFSVVVTYLVVAALSVGTLIAFGIGALTQQDEVTVTSSYLDYSEIDDEGNPVDPRCIEDTYDTTIPRMDRVWWVLAINPYVVLADASPTTWQSSGANAYPADLFGQIKYGVRQAQIAPDLDNLGYDGCAALSTSPDPETPREIIDRTTPSWAVGLGIHALLAAAALVGAIAATRVPARRLAAGSRIA